MEEDRQLLSINRQLLCRLIVFGLEEEIVALEVHDAFLLLSHIIFDCHELRSYVRQIVKRLKLEDLNFAKIDVVKGFIICYRQEIIDENGIYLCLEKLLASYLNNRNNENQNELVTFLQALGLCEMYQMNQYVALSILEQQFSKAVYQSYWKSVKEIVFEDGEWLVKLPSIIKSKVLRQYQDIAKGSSTYYPCGSNILLLNSILFKTVNPVTAVGSNLLTTSHSSSLYTKFLEYIAINVPIILLGESGCGKSTTIKEAARFIGSEDNLQYLQLDDQIDSKSLIGSYVCSEVPGEFVFLPGILLEAAIHGYWLIIEDINLASIDIISTICYFVENEEYSFPNSDIVIKIHPSFRVIGTITTNGSQQHIEKAKLANMKHFYSIFQCIFMEVPTFDDIKLIVHSKFPNFPHQILNPLIEIYGNSKDIFLRSNINMSNGFTLRELMKVCSRINSMYKHDFLKKQYLTESMKSNMFCELVCVTVDPLRNLSTKTELIKILMEYVSEWNLSDELVELNVINRSITQPEIIDDSVVIGRIRLPRSVDVNQRNINNTFVLTKYTLKYLESIASCVANNEPVLLVGETGTGKTTVIQQLAKLMGVNMVVQNMSIATESTDLFGGFKPVSLSKLIQPVFSKFIELFRETFSVESNQKALSMMLQLFENGKRANLTSKERGKIYLKLIESMIQCSKKAIGKGMNDWLTCHDDCLKLKSNTIKIVNNANFGFSYIEGMIVNAMKSGFWILLDEINLASPETLQSILGILEGQTYYSNNTPIRRNSNFRVFGAMNPPTDVGKKELVPSIRSRFSEIFVVELEDFNELRNIVHKYLEGVITEEAAFESVVNIYLHCRQQAGASLVDGNEGKPHYTLRTLTRTLQSICKFAEVGIPRKRALYEGFELFFSSILCDKSRVAVRNLLKQSFKIDSSVNLDMPTRRPGKGEEWVLFAPFWLKAGNLPQLDLTESNGTSSPKFIATPSVQANIRFLTAAICCNIAPILLQGPTSAGKTSMIEYIAAKCGKRCIRINNHEHTDIQEYIGGYVTTADGSLQFRNGLLVEALLNGYWIILDELNLAPSEVLEALNRLLDDNRELYIPETGETVQPADGFFLFATQNPAGLYGGRKELSRAFRNRFVEVHVSDIPPNELEEILGKVCAMEKRMCTLLVSTMKQLQIRRFQSSALQGKQGAITPRDLFKWGKRKFDTKLELACEGYMLLGEKHRTITEKLELLQVILDVFSITDPALHIIRSLYFKDDELVQFKKQMEKGEVLIQGVPRLAITSEIRRMWTLVSKCLENAEPVVLIGGAGSGKTTICQLLAAHRNQNIYILNCHQSTEASDIIGGLRPVRGRQQILESLLKELQQIKEILTFNPQFNDHFSSLMELFGYFSAGQEDAASPAFLEKCNIAIMSINLREDTLDSQTVLEPEMDSKKSRKLPVKSELFQKLIVCNSLIKRFSSLFEWVDGPLVNAMRNGDIFVLDEINLAEDAVIERLNSVLESTSTLTLAEKIGSDANSIEDCLIKAHPNFRFLATMNPGDDFGKKELSPALRSRFTEVFVNEFSSRDDVIAVVSEILKCSTFQFHNLVEDISCSIMDFMEWLQDIANKSSIPFSYTLRDILGWAKFVCQWKSANEYDVYFSLIHGAFMTLIDGLAVGHSINKSVLKNIKEQSLQQLLTKSPPEFHCKLKHSVADMEGLQWSDSFLSSSVQYSNSLCYFGPFSVPIGRLPLNHDQSYVIDSRNTQSNFQRIARAMQLPRPILLEGPPGVGKSSVIANLAAITGNKLVRINLSEYSELSDLLGTDLPVGTSESGIVQFKWYDGTFLAALKRGDWVLLDELNLAPQTVLEGLNSCFDHRETVYIPEIGQSISCPSSFRVFASQNPLSGGGGRKGLPKSFLSRFSRVYIEEMNENDMIFITQHAFKGRVALGLIDLVPNVVKFTCKLQEGIMTSAFGAAGFPWEFNLRDIFRLYDYFVSLNHDSGIDLSIKMSEGVYSVFVRRMRTKADQDFVLQLFSQCFAFQLSVRRSPEILRISKLNVLIGRHSFQINLDNLSIRTIKRKILNKHLYKELEIALISFKQRWPLLLTGPMKSGKRNIVRNLAYISGNIKNFRVFHCTASTDSSDLLGTFEQFDIYRHIAGFIDKLDAICVDIALSFISGKDHPSKTQYEVNLLSEYFALRSRGSCIVGSKTLLDDGKSFFDAADAIAQKLHVYLTGSGSKAKESQLTSLKEALAFCQKCFNNNVSAGFEWVDGIIIRALMEGWWLLVENVNLCSVSILDRLNSLLETNGNILLSECGYDRIISPHENFRIFFTMDPESGELSRAMRNRCLEIYVPYIIERKDSLATSNLIHSILQNYKIHFNDVKERRLLYERFISSAKMQLLHEGVPLEVAISRSINLINFRITNKVDIFSNPNERNLPISLLKQSEIPLAILKQYQLIKESSFGLLSSDLLSTIELLVAQILKSKFQVDLANDTTIDHKYLMSYLFLKCLAEIDVLTNEGIDLISDLFKMLEYEPTCKLFRLITVSKDSQFMKLGLNSSSNSSETFVRSSVMEHFIYELGLRVFSCNKSSDYLHFLSMLFYERVSYFVASVTGENDLASSDVSSAYSGLKSGRRLNISIDEEKALRIIDSLINAMDEILVHLLEKGEQYKNVLANTNLRTFVRCRDRLWFMLATSKVPIDLEFLAKLSIMIKWIIKCMGSRTFASQFIIDKFDDMKTQIVQLTKTLEVSWGSKCLLFGKKIKLFKSFGHASLPLSEYYYNIAGKISDVMRSLFDLPSTFRFENPKEEIKLRLMILSQIPEPLVQSLVALMSTFYCLGTDEAVDIVNNSNLNFSKLLKDVTSQVETISESISARIKSWISLEYNYLNEHDSILNVSIQTEIDTEMKSTSVAYSYFIFEKLIGIDYIRALTIMCEIGSISLTTADCTSAAITSAVAELMVILTRLLSNCVRRRFHPSITREIQSLLWYLQAQSYDYPIFVKFITRSIVLFEFRLHEITRSGLIQHQPSTLTNWNSLVISSYNQKSLDKDTPLPNNTSSLWGYRVNQSLYHELVCNFIDLTVLANNFGLNCMESSNISFLGLKYYKEIASKTAYDILSVKEMTFDAMLQRKQQILYHFMVIIMSCQNFIQESLYKQCMEQLKHNFLDKSNDIISIEFFDHLISSIDNSRIKNLFEKCMKPVLLLDYKRDSPLTSKKCLNSGIVFALLGVLRSHLSLPTDFIDPVVKPRLKAEILGDENNQVSKWSQVFLSIRHLASMYDPSLIYENQLKCIHENEEMIVKYNKKQIYRPNCSAYTVFLGDLSELAHVADEERILSFIEKAKLVYDEAATSVSEINYLMSEEQVIQENLRIYLSRLQANHNSYEDIISAVSAGISQLSFGLNHIVQAVVIKHLDECTLWQLPQTLSSVAFPILCSTDSLSKIDILIDRLFERKIHHDRLFSYEMSNEEDSKRREAVMLYELLFVERITFYESSHSNREVDSFYIRCFTECCLKYFERRHKEIEKHQLEEQKFVYKSEKNLENSFLFQGFIDNVSNDEIDLNESPESLSSANSLVNSTDNYFSRDLVPCFCRKVLFHLNTMISHHSIALIDNNNSSNDVQSLARYFSQLGYYNYLYQLLRTVKYLQICQRDLISPSDSTFRGFHILALGRSCLSANNTNMTLPTQCKIDRDQLYLFDSQSVSDWNPRNFYIDSYHEEYTMVNEVIGSLFKRIAELLLQFPHNDVLLNLVKLVAAICDKKPNESLSSMLVTIQQIAEKAQEWEKVASKGVSLQEEITKLLKVISRWRDIELSSWSSLLRVKEIDYCRDAQKTWYELYSSLFIDAAYGDIKASPVSLQWPTWIDSYYHKSSPESLCSKFKLKELYEDVTKYITNCNVGEFPSRLHLIRLFAVEVLLSCQSAPIGLLLYSIWRRYNRELVAIRNFEAKTLVSTKKKIDELCKTSWDYRNLYSIVDKSDRMHRQLSKSLKDYQVDVLELTLTQMMQNSELTDSIVFTETPPSQIPSNVSIFRDVVSELQNISNDALVQLSINQSVNQIYLMKQLHDEAVDPPKQVIKYDRFNNIKTITRNVVSQFEKIVNLTPEDESFLLASNNFRFGLRGAVICRDYCDEIFERLQSLRIPTASRSAKQLALKDLFSQLKQQGFSDLRSTVPTNIRSQSDIMQLPALLPLVFCADFTGSFEDTVISKCENYVYRNIEEISAVKQLAATNHSKDLNARDVIQMMSISENIFFEILKIRTFVAQLISELAESTSTIYNIRSAIQAENKLLPAQGILHSACMMYKNSSKALLPFLQDVEELLVSIKNCNDANSPLTLFSQDQLFQCLQRIDIVRKELTEPLLPNIHPGSKVASLVGLRLNCNSVDNRKLYSHTDQMMIVSKFERLLQASVDLAQSLYTIDSVVNIPTLVQIRISIDEFSQNIASSLTSIHQSLSTRTCDNHDHNLDDIAVVTISTISQCLVSYQNLSRVSSAAFSSNQTTSEPQQQGFTDSFGQRHLLPLGKDDASATLSDCLNLSLILFHSLQLSKFRTHVDQLLSQLLTKARDFSFVGTSFDALKGVLVNVLPIIESINSISLIFLDDAILECKELGKLLYVIVRVFRSLISFGFCSSSNDSEENDDSNSADRKFEDDVEGTGMGEGEGLNDVSNQIENEDQLNGLKGDEEKQDTNKSKPGDNKLTEEEYEKGVEMSEDFEGDLYDKEEKEGEDEQDSDNDHEEEELDREMGGDFDMDNIVDEDKWNHDENKDNQQDNGKDQEEFEGTSKNYDADSNELTTGDHEELSSADQQEETPKNKEDDLPAPDIFEEKDLPKGESRVPDKTLEEDDKAMENQEDDLNESKMELDDGVELDDKGMDDEFEQDNNGDNDEDQEDQIDKKDENVVDEEVVDNPNDNVQNQGEEVPNNDDKLKSKQSVHNYKNSAYGVGDKDGNETLLDGTEKTENMNSLEEDSVAIQSMELEGKDNENVREQQNHQSGIGEGIREQESANNNTDDTLSADRLPPNPFRKQGDINEKWSRHLKMVDESISSRSQESSHDNNDNQTFAYEDIDDDNTDTPKQILGEMNEGNAHMPLSAMDTEEINEEKTNCENQLNEEVVKENKDKRRRLDDQNDDPNKSSNSNSESKRKKKNEETTQEDLIVDAMEIVESINTDAIANMAIDDISAYEHSNNSVSKVFSSSPDLDVLDLELQQVKPYSSEAFAEAKEAWMKLVAENQALSVRLCEQLRLVLDPTLANRLKGDYKTGKRINMKKIINYVASGFRKDAIWLRRTKPSKREYQILLMIDNSKSMGMAGNVAMSSLATVASALTRLEVGELSICSFAEGVYQVHPFERAFTVDDGARSLLHFDFHEEQTKLAASLKTVDKIFEEGRAKLNSSYKIGGSIAALQLCFIITDARIDSDNREQLGAVVRDLADKHVLVMIIIIDKNADKRDSIFNTKSIEFTPTGMVTRSYMDNFPFTYYVVVKHSEMLADCLADAIKQWFEMIRKGIDY